ncbi:MAG: hypothetical protein F6J93_11250 [Oscillatoria sp. SIO1A7]|nr:hypothetical protein [Oscillatoria sp. SIO1A7]
MKQRWISGPLRPRHFEFERLRILSFELGCRDRSCSKKQQLRSGSGCGSG